MHWFTESLYDATRDTVDPDGKNPSKVEFRGTSATDSEFFEVEFEDGTKRLVHIQEVK